MQTTASTIKPMAKSEKIDIRTSKSVKDAIFRAAAKNGRQVGPWLIWLAASADSDVMQAVQKEMLR